MNSRDTLYADERGVLTIGGASTLSLAKEFGTPLYVFDRAHFERLCRVMKQAVLTHYGEGEIAYAAKAFCTVGVFSILNELGLSADVVSGGELYIALQAGFKPEKLYFHGNAKTASEIDMAVSSGVGAIVLECEDEVDDIIECAKKYGKKQGVMLRVNPSVEAHTHSFVQTAKTDSKFGLQLDDEALPRLIEKIESVAELEFLGLHIHIGSQIFDVAPYKIALEKLVKFIKNLENRNIFVKKLNMGGGFGITYTSADPTFSEGDYEGFISEISKKLLSLIAEYGIKKPALVFEPGRSLVGEAGITLYTVIAIKDIPDVRKYVSIDGGMFENPRFALYGSRYEAVLCSNANAEKTQTVTIAGKCCESGDIITADAPMPPLSRGDIIAVLSTGAYNYSMASNYNCNPVPPVVSVYEGNAEYMVKPQTYADIARNNTGKVK